MRNVYKFRIGTVFGLLLFVLTGYQSLAQVGSYSMTPLSGTFNEVVGGTATSLPATSDDGISASFPIGFDFQFGGATYTSVRASSNGLLTFNATGSSTTTNNLATTTATARPGIAPLWDDLQCTSGVTYQVAGTAPNRTLTVQWLNMEWNYGANASVISFQVILYETSNTIDLVYRQEAAAGNPTGSGGASIGLMGTASTDYLSLQNSSAAPTTSNSASTNNIGTKPATGQIYRFNPPPADPATPVQLGGIPTCSLGAQLGFTTLSESCSVSNSATGFDIDGVSATVTDFSCAPAPITTATLDANIGNNCPAWYSYSIVVNGVTVASNQCNQTGFDLTPYLPLTSVSIIAENAIDDTEDNITISLTVNLNYEVPFSFPADVVYYWQTTPTGTSQATPHVDPYYVFANGTYYVRAYNTATSVWSTGSSSVTVSNFPLAAAPPAPVADVNPSCAPDGSSLTVDAPPADVEYYWQGTTADGTSNALPATSPYEYTISGTYHVSAYDVVSQCWSASSSITVTVDEVIPPTPILTQTDFNYCAGAISAPVSAPLPVLNVSGNCSLTATASGFDTDGVSATVNDFSCALAPITSATLNATIGGNCPSWYSYSIVVNGVTVATNQCNQTGFDLTPYLPFTSVSIVAVNAPDDSGDNVNLNLTVNINYSGVANTQPAYSLNWYDASTGGNILGSGTTLETVGTSVMPAATFGSYDFYVGSILGGCSSATNEMVTVNITDVNAELIPVNVTCNGGENGSFTLGAVECGLEPFSYSIDGGAFDPAIPTNLTAGTYSVVIEDDNGLTSAPITVIVAEPAVPSDITVSNINYFSADVAWTTTGDETSWTIEYGPAGFTPGTGTVETASASPYTLTGLTEDTEYDVYITPACGAGAQAGGPESFSTNQGFITWDNMCPDVDFVDISATGTDLNLTDDSEAGLTMPIPFNYQGTDVTVLTVGNNGGVVLGSLTENVGYGGNFNTMADGTIFAWGDDLDDETGSVYWDVIGTSPNQIFIVQWDNSNNWSNGAGTVTFQMQFYEATNEIYFVYDDVVFGDSPDDDFGGNADIGVSGPTDITVSTTSQTYLQNNSCVHFYNELCPNPTNPVVTTFQEEVIIDWSAGLYGETEWTVIYGPAGFDPATSGTTLTTTAPSVNILGLTQVTNYDVYIYAECMLDDLTSPGLLVEFQTLPWCNTPTEGTNTTAVDSLFAGWNWAEVVGAPNGLSGFNIQYGMTGFDLYNGTEIATGSVELFDTIADASFLGGGVYQYYIQAECGTDTSNYAGPFSFVMPLTTDSVCGAEMLLADGTVYTFNNAGATVGTGESAIAPGATGFQTQTGWGNSTLNNTTWYMFEAPASGNVRINHNVGNNYAGQSAIYTVTDCGDYATFELVAANDNSMVNNAAAPNYTVCGLTPGATYYLLHDGNSATTGNHVISIIPINLNAGDYSSTLEVCTGGEVDLFDGITGNDAGGVWTAINAAAATQLTDNIWNSAGLAYNIPFEFEYRLTDGCAYDSVIALVEIFPLSSAGPDGSITVCRNEPVDLLSGLSGNVDLGGTWYDPSNTVLSNSEIVASNIPGQFNYDYVAGNGVCPDDTALVLVNVLSTCDYLNIQEMFFADMTVYPNPSNAVFNVANYGSTEVFSYEVTDIDGRVITSKEAAINGTTTTEIDLKDKVTGVYFIKVYNENAEKTFRVVLQ